MSPRNLGVAPTFVLNWVRENELPRPGPWERLGEPPTPICDFDTITNNREKLDICEGKQLSVVCFELKLDSGMSWVSENEKQDFLESLWWTWTGAESSGEGGPGPTSEGRGPRYSGRGPPTCPRT